MRIVAVVTLTIFSNASNSEAYRNFKFVGGGQDEAHVVQRKASVNYRNIGALLSKVMNLVKGFVDLTPLKIELDNFTCIQNEGITSEIYHGRYLKYNSNIIDVECNTHKIHVGQPEHWWEDSPFTSDTLIQADNLGLHLQCDTDVFSEYVKFLANAKTNVLLQKVGLGSTRKVEPVWTGRALCDIKTLEIANPKIYLETLDSGILKRKKSNVERFHEKFIEAFGSKEVEDEPPEAIKGKEPTVENGTLAAREANPLITFNSLQKGSCLAKPYAKTGIYAETQHAGLCGFLLLRMELSIDRLKVVWTQEHTKFVAKLLSMSRKFTLPKILWYAIRHASSVAEALADGVNTVRRKLDVFGRMFARKDSKSDGI